MTEGFKDVFISYGRRESKDFARRLHDRLREAGMDVWFDQNDIPLGVDFQEQIDDGIDRAHSFIFIIAPHSLRSPYCLKEVQLAVKRNKRIVPILHIEPEDRETWGMMHPTVSKLNWVYFREKYVAGEPLESFVALDDFEMAFQGLVNLLEGHSEYVKAHTRYLVKALKWDKDQRDERHLLVGNELAEAEKWLQTEFERTQPPCKPSFLHAEYICESRKHAQEGITDTFICYYEKNQEPMGRVREALMYRGVTTWFDQTDIKTGANYIEAIEEGAERADNFLYFLTEGSVSSSTCLRELEVALAHHKRIIPLMVEPLRNEQLPERIRHYQYIDFTDNREDSHFASKNEKTDFERDIDEILRELSKDAAYYRRHNELLAQALRWRREGQGKEHLLPRFRLKRVRGWLDAGLRRKIYQPTEAHREFVEASEARDLEKRKARQAYWLKQAQKWADSERDPSLYLTGTRLTAAEQWHEDALQNDPEKPDPLVKEFIYDSRQAAEVVGLTDAYVCYAKRDREFALQLNEWLAEEGHSTWVDQEQKQHSPEQQRALEDAIRHALTFVFVLTPASAQAKRALKELQLAASYGKRIVVVEREEVEREASLKKVMQHVGRDKWVGFRRFRDEEGFALRQLTTWLKAEQGYVETHTRLLTKAFDWEDHKRNPARLLVDHERRAAEEWLVLRFKNRPMPCLPSDLHALFIGESEKAANGGMTDIFFSYAREEGAMRDKLRNALTRQSVTTWVDTEDIRTGVKFGEAIKEGIEHADAVVYFISPQSVKSKYCRMELEHAARHHKRVIPILVQETPMSEVPEAIGRLQYIDFTQEERFEHGVGELVAEIEKDRKYYRQHKELLVKAIRWERQNRSKSVMLRGFELERASQWLQHSGRFVDYPPTALQREYVSESEAKAAEISPEVFVCYESDDVDFARQLHWEFTKQGKVTWYDQQYIPEEADFGEEIRKGIDASDNFIFVLSPDSLHSQQSLSELEYALGQGKRALVAKYQEPLAEQTLPAALDGLQMIDFRRMEADFSISFANLTRLLDTDRAHVQQHAKWARKAAAWLESDKNAELLLGGSEFSVAEVWLKDTVEEQKKPQPTSAQTAFIEASRERILAAERREKRRVLFLKAMVIFMAFLAVGALILAYWAYDQRQVALAAKDDARQSEKAALLAKDEAKRSEEEAIKAKEDAEKQKELAEEQKRIAETEKERAEQEQIRAEDNARRAEEQTALAVEKQEEADAARIDAEAAKYIANLAKDRAEDQKKKADRLRQLSVARAMAVQAIQLADEDTMLAALLAYHAYKFIDENGGSPEAPEIFNALRLTLGRLSPEEAETRIKAKEARTIAFDPIGAVVVYAGEEGRLYVTDAGTNNPRKAVPLNGEPTRYRTAAFLDDGLYLAAGTASGDLHVWEYGSLTSKAPARFGLHNGPVIRIVAVPGKPYLASVGRDGAIFICETGNGRLERVVSALHRIESGPYSAIAVNENGTRLAAGTAQGQVSYWDIEDPTQPKMLYRDGYFRRRAITALEFGPGGEQLAIGYADGHLELKRDLTEKGFVSSSELASHKAAVTDLDFHLDQLASASTDGTVRIWNYDKAEPDFVTFDAHQSFVWSVAFSPLGDLLASSSETNVYLLNPNPQDLAAALRGKLSRDLTDGEWEKFVGEDIDYQSARPESARN